jgi:hypothetical protein
MFDACGFRCVRAQLSFRLGVPVRRLSVVYLAWTPTSSPPQTSSCTGGSGARCACTRPPGACLWRPFPRAKPQVRGASARFVCVLVWLHACFHSLGCTSVCCCCWTFACAVLVSGKAACFAVWWVVGGGCRGEGLLRHSPTVPPSHTLVQLSRPPFLFRVGPFAILFICRSAPNQTSTAERGTTPPPLAPPAPSSGAGSC